MSDGAAQRADPEALAVIDRLIGAMAGAQESPPFSDQALVDARSGRAVLLTSDVAAAILRGDELELAVLPEARGRGAGAALVRQALATGKPVLAWAHGDHPAARALAERFDWAPTRVLLQLRAPVGDPPSDDLAGASADSSDAMRVRPFRPGADDAAWLGLNAAAFAHHPEQGAMTLADLDARQSEPWFRADDLLLLDDSDATLDPEARLAGSCWLKVENGIGEFYAVAVRPDLQGRGIGRRLMRAGFDRLRSLGIRTASLYVEADNAPALALYRRSGFTEYARDVQYRAPGHH